jgi:hypothetical protein
MGLYDTRASIRERASEKFQERRSMIDQLVGDNIFSIKLKRTQISGGAPTSQYEANTFQVSLIIFIQL